MKTVRRPPYPKWNPGYFPCSSLTPLPLSSRRPSVSFGGFGLREVGGLRGKTPGGQGEARSPAPVRNEIHISGEPESGKSGTPNFSMGPNGKPKMPKQNNSRGFPVRIQRPSRGRRTYVPASPSRSRADVVLDKRFRRYPTTAKCEERDRIERNGTDSRG